MPLLPRRLFAAAEQRRCRCARRRCCRVVNAQDAARRFTFCCARAEALAPAHGAHDRRGCAAEPSAAPRTAARLREYRKARHGSARRRARLSPTQPIPRRLLPFLLPPPSCAMRAELSPTRWRASEEMRKTQKPYFRVRVSGAADAQPFAMFPIEPVVPRHTLPNSAPVHLHGSSFRMAYSPDRSC